MFIGTAPSRFHTRIFSHRGLRSRSGLLPVDSAWGYCRSIRERRVRPVVESCGLGQTMSGVIAAMRRTLLSCTSLARNGLAILGTLLGAGLVWIAPANAGDLPFVEAIATYELNHQEIAVLATALALLGFSV